MANIPSLRWGIITTGGISRQFVTDILLDRPDAKVKHIIQAIGSSSKEKCEKFAADNCPDEKPHLYGSYDEVYADSTVDVVYIGSPHSFHKRDCLNAIAAGKNILCEKPFTMNKAEAETILDAARQKGVYVHEAMWLRHRPIVRQLQRMLYEDKVIGDVFRTFSDFHLHIDIRSLPETSRYKSLDLGAGSMLDIGIYSLTWALLTLDPGTPTKSERPDILATQSFLDGIEVSTSILLKYTSTGRQGIITSTNMINTESQVIARIEGTEGHVEVFGGTPASPKSFIVYPKLQGSPIKNGVTKPEGKRYELPEAGAGFFHEADHTALNIIAGRTQSEIMPWSETIRVMEIMDEIRRQGGTRYAADDL